MARVLTITCRHCNATFTRRAAGRAPVTCSPECRAADARRLKAVENARHKSHRAARRASAPEPAEPDLAPHIATAPPEPRLHPVALARARKGSAARHAPKPGRKGIDPTTTTPEYSEDECEWFRAVERYRREARRPFVTLREYLQIAFALGYRKAAEPGPLPGCGPAGKCGGDNGG